MAPCTRAVIGTVVRYLNPYRNRQAFEDLLRSPYVVDKTGIVSALVPFIGVENRFVCVARPRCFGKTVNANTIGCFLGRGLDAEGLFADLEVARDSRAMAHLGAHNVLYIDFSELPDVCGGFDDYLDAIRSGVVNDLCERYPHVGIAPGPELIDALTTVYNATRDRFVFVMDEWDSMFFNPLFSPEDQRSYLMFLKQLLKSKPYVELAYMTGILPIAKHSTGSELNMFTEYSAADDPKFERYFGFTEEEVRRLCAIHEARVPKPRVDYAGLKCWYYGYLNDDDERRFNPRSVALALSDDRLKSYWTESGPYDEIYYYIRNDVASVRDDLVRMVAGEPVEAQMRNYAASSMSLATKDEIFSAMVVYGFLTYHDGCVSIPNHELMVKFHEVLAKEEMGYVARLARRSKEMLEATLRGETDAMVDIIQAAHDQEVPLLRYAYEADLAALVSLVYLSARDRYWVRREEPGGRGVADVAFIPKDPHDRRYPPFVVELKCDGSVGEALAQIRGRGYAGLFADGLMGEKPSLPPLAVAIVWDSKNKVHAAAVEELAGE